MLSTVCNISKTGTRLGGLSSHLEKFRALYYSDVTLGTPSWFFGSSVQEHNILFLLEKFSFKLWVVLLAALADASTEKNR